MQGYTEALKKYCRLADYIAAAQIYLKDNAFLEDKLDFVDIKPRILGHWGTSPGINIVYGAINAAINTFKEFDFMYIVGPGHGFPAYQAGTFLDGSLSYFYPDKIPFNRKGMEEVIYKFSTPYGFPSHINPESPGAILEGGELGYALATAYGAVLDEKDLIAVTLIGDGEAETGPTATAWQLNKFLNLKRDGVPLPILHLNGYKISGPTIFSSYTDEELLSFFTSMGYSPILVDGYKEDLHLNLLKAFEESVNIIKSERENSTHKPKFPMIILKTPKGMGAPEYVKDRKIVGNSESHQVVFSDLHNDIEELALLEEWLNSYKINEIMHIDETGKIELDKELQRIIPGIDKSVGLNIYARRGALQFNKPVADDLFYPVTEFSVESLYDSMQVAGKYMERLYSGNPDKFRLFSPDETYSNHLQDVFNQTARAWNPQVKEWEKDLDASGRVMEMLSEHSLFGMLQGYTLTGRYGFFVSYEAFAQIVASMADQYVKFLKQAREVSWRLPVPSLNIILSSLLERQDHNGFSHQNPSFIASNLDRDLDIVNVYYPADQNILLHTLDKAMSDVNKLNIIVVGKRNKNVFLSKEAAKAHVYAGASIWEGFSDENPDIVIATAGDYVTNETVKGIALFREMFPNIRVRFVNFNNIDIVAEETLCNIEYLFEENVPVLFNYHGYASTIKHLFYDTIDPKRVIINGFKELGSTTTPFDMLARNEMSRFHTVKNMVTLLSRYGKLTFDEAMETHNDINEKLASIKTYNILHGLDPDDI